MADKLSRRDFIKTSSVAAAGASVLSFNPLVSALESAGTKSRVVIAKDATCVGNQAKIQSMVDGAIMMLTGVSEPSKAYEALFPAGKLTSTTKILIKYTETVTKVTDMGFIALQNGLKSMLGGTFPPANITAINTGDDSGTQTFKIGSVTFAIRKVFVDTDYFINYAPCTAFGTPPLRMGIKNMITAVTPKESRGTFHTNPNLAILSSQETFKSKLILVLTDGIQVRLTSSGSNVPAYTIIASKDMIACEYQAVQLLKSAGNFNDATANTFLTAAAATQYGLGTNDPTKMELINWTPTNIVMSSGDVIIPNDQIQVKSLRNQTIIQYPVELGTSSSLTVYDVHGRGIWATSDFRSGAAWNHCDAAGVSVPSGIYLYQLKAKGVVIQGKFDIRR
jgi:hypothetical protein